MLDYRLYDVTVSTLTPLHIGNGRELLNEYDYVIRDGRTWRINEHALLDAYNVDDPAIAARLAERPPAELLPTGRLDPASGLFRYVIQGTPRSDARGAQLREQIKDAYDRPYLPGSSLKGALRTVLAWTLWAQRGLKPDATRLQRRREWAASAYERELFGRSPNHDLLRALQVGDSAGLPAAGTLMLANVRVRGRGEGQGAPVEVEAVKPDTIFSLTLKVDSALFTDWARRAELPAQGEEWLTNLPGLVRAYSAARIRRELAWYRERRAPTIEGFYRQLAAARLGDNRCLLQIGWGTGWESKTFGSHLQADQPFMERIIRTYRLAIGRRQEGEPFPKSRRVSVAFQRGRDGRISEQPAPPLGWCLLEMKERTR